MHLDKEKVTMVKEFKTFYDKLPENYQKIINGTITRMKKTHKKKSTRKVFDIKHIINFYLKQNNMTTKELLELCYEADEDFSEDTYKSILKRNLANIQDNKTFKLVSKILKIPSDERGNAYIEYDIPEELQIANIFTHKVYPFSSEYYPYLTEFQNNTVYDNFKCLGTEDQQSILYLTQALFYNQTSPELFMHSEGIDEYL